MSRRLKAVLIYLEVRGRKARCRGRSESGGKTETLKIIVLLCDVSVDLLVQPFTVFPYLVGFCTGLACRAGVDMRVTGVSEASRSLHVPLSNSPNNSEMLWQAAVCLFLAMCVVGKFLFASDYGQTMLPETSRLKVRRVSQFPLFFHSRYY